MNVSSIGNKLLIRIPQFSTSFDVLRPLAMTAERSEELKRYEAGLSEKPPRLTEYRNVGISTSLEFPEGDMAVIGTTQVPSEDNSDAAIIVIVTAKIL